MGEIDFVILAPEGLLAIEVKGGGVALADGVWRYTDRFGREHKNYEGPFKQARSGMFSLKAELEEKLSRLLTGQLVFGWAVALPDCDFDATSVEWSSVLVLDASRLRRQGELRQIVQSVFDYWRKKESKQKVASEDVLKTVLSAMRPNFELVPSLRNDADRLTETMERLTQEQYDRLDIMEDNPRILCTGGAGTGKTFLAIEVARRRRSRGLSVAFLCSSPVMAAFVRTRLKDSDVLVMSYEDALRTKGQFDVLIADEAQDFLDSDGLGLMDGLVIGGLHEGCWVVFLDPNAQSGLAGRYDPEVLDLMMASGAVKATLSRNCRNTLEVVTQTTLLTAADVGVATAGHGPSVRFGFFDSPETEAEVLVAELERLHEEAIPSGSISIVSPVGWESSAARRLPSRWSRKMRIMDEISASHWPINELSFSSITDFKGFENDFVLVVDVESISGSTKAISELYVSMTRARSGLWMALPDSIQDELETVGKGNLQLVKEIVERSQADVGP